MKSNARKSRQLIFYSIVLILVNFFFLSSSYSQNDGVLLKFKAEAGRTHRYSDVTSAKLTLNWPGGEKDVIDSKVSVFFNSYVESVGRRGRMTLLRKPHRMIFKKVFSTETESREQVSFDSANKADLVAAKKNPRMAHLITFLDSGWKLKQDATGEIIDYEPILPKDSEVPPGFELVVNNMIENLVEEGKILFPEDAVSVGETWDGGVMVTLFPELGRVERRINSTLSEIKESGDKRIAVIKLQITAELNPDDDSGVQAKFKEFKESGSLLFAIDEGRIKELKTTQSVTIVYSGPNQPQSTTRVTEHIFKEEPL